MNILDKINSIKTQSELEKFKNDINEAINKRSDFITLCEIANNASLKSFGYIKESFEDIAPLLFKSNEGKNIVKKYIKTIKENKNLSKLHQLYENIRKANKEIDVDFFINNITNVEWGVNKNTLKEDTKKIGRILAEGILKIGNKDIILKNNNSKLDNAIEFIAENKKNKNNISKYSNAASIIREHIANNPIINVFEEDNLDSYASNLLESFNEKYANELNTEEISILKEIKSSSNKEELFNKFKNECIEKLKNAEKNFSNNGENLEKEKVSEILEKINSKTFVIENITKDICGFAEIIKLF